MTTRAPIIQQQPAQAAQLCDYCHIKPKFSNHAYCSKTCGTQAASMCNYCHKKPKFQNFEFCGKNCASLANPGGVKPAGPGPAPAARAPNAFGQQQKTKGVAPNGAQTQPFTIDPLQIATLVASQLPQLQGLINPAGAQQQQPQQGPALNQSAKNPFLNRGGPHAQTQAPAPANGIPQPHFSSSSNGVNYGAPPSGNGGLGLSGIGNAGYAGQQQQYAGAGAGVVDAEDLECLIPGCGKPVHVDSKGLKTSDYCSQRHREEAVATGIASPCIMCMTKPQSHTDYFCSRTCREESLKKPYPTVPVGTTGVSGVEEIEDEDEQGGLAQN